MRKNRLLTTVSFALVLALALSFVIPGFASSGNVQLTAAYKEIKMTINGIEFKPTDANGNSTEPFIVNGSTYTPARAVAEALGYDVGWDAVTNTVEITSRDLRVLGLAPITEDNDIAALAAALSEITGVDLDDSYSVIGLVIKAAGLDALVDALEARGEAEAMTVAVAAGLVSETPDTSAAGLNKIVLNVAQFLGLSRGYVGHTADPDFFQRLDNVWNNTPSINQPEIGKIGEQVFFEGLLTGFNVRNSAYAVNFDPELTMFYSHSSLKHVKQLITLFKTLGIEVSVSLDPKQSYYIWEGEVGYDLEYDVIFEFDSEEDMLAIDALVKEYAQKPGENLLDGSWWTPLYGAGFDLGEGYTELVCNTIYFEDSSYYVISYGPKGEISDMVCDMFVELGAADAVQSPIFTNNDFLSYVVTELVVETAE